MADSAKSYTFSHSGGTTGKSGRPYRYAAGVPFDAPDGEFDHLGDGVYTAGPTRGAGYATREMVPAGAVVAPLPPGADPARDVMVSATPGTPPDPAAVPSVDGRQAAARATLSEDGGGESKAADGSEKASKSAPDRRISKGNGFFLLTEDGEEVGRAATEKAAKAWQKTGDLPE